MQRQSIPAELLADVKNHLNITWDDEATDNKIRGFIAAAMAYLNEKGGSVLEYDADGLPSTLMWFGKQFVGIPYVGGTKQTEA